MAKRLYAMLDLEPNKELAESNDLHDLIDRIQSAAGPVATVTVPPGLVAEAADALYRTRTLVATCLRAADDALIGDVVSDGAGEIEIAGASDIDIEAVIALARRRNVKLRVTGDDDFLKDAAFWAKSGVRFAVLERDNPDIPEILKKIARDGLQIGLKFRGCSSFQQCCDLYVRIAETISEGWIWPGSVRYSAGPGVQNDIVGHLRSADLKRPQGCGVRPNPV